MSITIKSLKNEGLNAFHKEGYYTPEECAILWDVSIATVRQRFLRKHITDYIKLGNGHNGILLFNIAEGDKYYEKHKKYKKRAHKENKDGRK